MLPSPAKRRKISPTTALPVASEVINESQGLRSTHTQTQTQTQRPAITEAAQNSPALSRQRSQRRASFQSPTKASLARFNPALIPAPSPKKISRSPSRATPAPADLSGQTTRSAGRHGVTHRPSLVQQVLGGRKASELSAGTSSEVDAPATPTDTQEGGDENQQDESHHLPKESFSTAIARAFNAVPAAQSVPREPLRPRQPSGLIPTPAQSQDVLLNSGSPKGLISQSPHPNSARLRPRSRTRHTNHHDDEEQLFSLITSGGGAHSLREEPELPPTPIQLGISAVPDEPRGLDSLSSSGRRRRFRDEQSKKTSPLQRHLGNGDVTASSPLKHKSKATLQRGAGRPRSRQKQGADVSKSKGQVELAEHDTGRQQHTTAPADDQVPEISRHGHEPASKYNEIENIPSQDTDFVQKRKLLTSLKFQLDQLQSELSQLEALAKEPGPTEGTQETTIRPLDSAIYAILSTKNISCDPSFHKDPASPSKTLEQEIKESFQSSINTGPEPLPFLTLFLPGNLRLKTQTKCLVNPHEPSAELVNQADREIPEAQHQIHLMHTLDFNASPPFPAHVFSCRLAILIDPENRTVSSVKVLALDHGMSESNHQGRKRKRGPNTSSNKSLLHSSLGQWISRRLRSGSLHERDVGGLVWGIGQWWTATVERAKCFASLERQYCADNAHGLVSEWSKESDAQWYNLLPYLYRDGFTFNIRGSDSTLSSMWKKVRFHLKYDLLLDWTSEIETRLDLLVNGIDLKTEAGIQDVFMMLMQRKKIANNGLVTAHEETWKRAVNAIIGVTDMLKGQHSGRLVLS